MKTTIRDVAREVSLSHTTVSRVLNGREDIAIPDITRRRVEEAARALGYRVNPAARALATGRTGVVSLWASGVYRAFWADVIVQVEGQARRAAYELIINDLSARVGRPADDDPSVWPIDGILALGCPAEVAAYLALPASQRQPLVSMGVYHNEKTDFVGLELGGATRQALRHLLSVGCRRIAYVGPLNLNADDPRRVAYEEEMRESEKAPQMMGVPGGSHRGTRAAARRLIIDYHKTHGLPDGLFCHNDEIAIGAYRGLCDLGVRVPDDVAIVGCDGIEDTEYLETPLSTIALPLEAMCEQAWRLLSRRWAKPEASVEGVHLPAQFVPRASSLRAPA